MLFDFLVFVDFELVVVVLRIQREGRFLRRHCGPVALFNALDNVTVKPRPNIASLKKITVRYY